MATLTVWKFASAHGATEPEYTLGELQKQEWIKVHDAAIVSSDAVLDEVAAAFAAQEMEMISANLSVEQEKALQDAFSD